MSNKMLSYKELAERLGLKVGTLRTWVMQGRLKGVKFGSRRLFPEPYVEELERKGVPPPNGNL